MTDPGSDNVTIPSNLVEILQGAEHVVVLTGAGISAESGVLTLPV